MTAITLFETVLNFLIVHAKFQFVVIVKLLLLHVHIHIYIHVYIHTRASGVKNSSKPLLASGGGNRIIWQNSLLMSF